MRAIYPSRRVQKRAPPTLRPAIVIILVGVL
jgi:hypothetical protein